MRTMSTSMCQTHGDRRGLFANRLIRPGRGVQIALLTLGLVLAACGSSSSGTSSPSSTQRHSASSSSYSPPLVQASNSANFGTILVDNNGLTLYTLINAGHPAPCVADCGKVWPPLRVPPGTTTPNGGPGVSGLGVSRSGTVVTYMGFPLFHYSGDKTASQVNGNGVASFGGVWTIVKPGTKPGT